MHFYCCSSWDFLQSHYTVLLSAFLFFLFHAPLDVISHFLVFLRSILRVRIFSFSVLSFCRTDQAFLRWPRVLSSDDVCQGFQWPFQSLLCWRLWSLMVRGANFPPIIAWKVSNTLGSFSFPRSNWGLCVLAYWFFSDEDGRSSSASRGHFQCVLAMFTPDRKRFLTKM